MTVSNGKDGSLAKFVVVVVNVDANDIGCHAEKDVGVGVSLYPKLYLSLAWDLPTHTSPPNYGRKLLVGVGRRDGVANFAVQILEGLACVSCHLM